MKKHIRMILLLVSVAITLSFTSVKTQAASNYENEIMATPLYKTLENARKTVGVKAVNKIIASTDVTPQNVEIVSLWARDAFKNKKRNPRYGLIYADSMATMATAFKSKNEKIYRQFMDTGLVVFFSSQLIAREDVARCTDKTAGQNYIANWSSDIGRLYVNYARDNYNKDQKNKLTQISINISNSRDLLYKDKSACASGIKAMEKAIENGKCDKNGACNGTEYVSLITMKDWMPIRHSIQKRLTDYLANLK